MRRICALLAVPILLLLGIVAAGPASAVEGGTLTSGTPVTGTITQQDREVGYRFAGTAGVHVTLDVTASSWTSGSARLYVHAPNGVLYLNCSLVGAPKFCDFTPNATGTWKVTLSPTATAVGSATFTYATDQVRPTLTAGTPQTTTIGIKGQNANTAFAGTVNQRVAFSTNASTWNGTAVMRIWAPGGANVRSCTLAEDMVCAYTPPQSGLYRVQIDPLDGAVGTVTLVHGGDQKSALTSGTPKTTVIAPRGIDARYTFTLTAGRHFTFDFTAANWGTGSATLYFIKPNGELWLNCLVEEGHPCNWTPDETGTWTAYLDPTETTTGSTTFTFANDQDKGLLAPTVPVTTTIAVRDQAAGYTFAGTKGAHMDLSVTAANFGTDPLGYAQLEVYRPSGDLFTFCFLTVGPTYCDFTPDVTGTWKVRLDPSTGTVGSATFALVPDQNKGALTPNTPVTMSISVKGQNAGYTFAGTSGSPVTFDVTATNWGTGGGATLRFYRPDGTPYDQCNFTVSATQCEFDPDVTGTWKVSLDPYQAAVGGATFAYHPS